MYSIVKELARTVNIEAPNEGNLNPTKRDNIRKKFVSDVVTRLWSEYEGLNNKNLTIIKRKEYYKSAAVRDLGDEKVVFEIPPGWLYNTKELSGLSKAEALLGTKGLSNDEKVKVMRFTILHEGGHIALNHKQQNVNFVTWSVLGRPAAIAGGTMIIVGTLVALAFLIPSLTRPIAFVSLCAGVGVMMMGGLGIATWDAKCSMQKAIKEWNHEIELEADRWAAQNDGDSVNAMIKYFNNSNSYIKENSVTHPETKERITNLQDLASYTEIS